MCNLYIYIYKFPEKFLYKITKLEFRLKSLNKGKYYCLQKLCIK